MTVPATPKQHDLIAGLAASKDIPAEAAAELFAVANAEGFTKQEAHDLIDSLFGEADRDIPEGLHTVPMGTGSPWAGQDVVVKRSKRGRLYATLTDGEYLNGKGLMGLSEHSLTLKAPEVAELVEGGIYVNADGDMIKVVRSQSGNLYGKRFEAGKWNYATGLLNGLTEDDRISAEQAAAFGKEHNRCVFCGRSLADERSRVVGYGPTCAETHNLPWGE